MGGGGGSDKGTAGLRQAHQKFLDYDSHARCGNRYEFGPPSAVASQQQQSSALVSKYHHSGHDERSTKPGGVIRPLCQSTLV